MLERQKVSLNKVVRFSDGLCLKLLLGHQHLLEGLTYLIDRPELLHCYQSAELAGHISDCLQL